jgi:CheY-like chemotaxis protein
VHTAEDGATGLEECTRLRSSLHLIICDQKMPGMTGAEVLAQIHQQAPELKLICMSGFLEEAGAGEVPFPVARLAKPMDPAILLRLVHETITGPSPS